MPARATQISNLTLRQLAELPPDTRPLPTVDAYDQLFPTLGFCLRGCAN
jgi:hypothetical protein